MILTANYEDALVMEVGCRAHESRVGLNFCVYVSLLDEIQRHWNLHGDGQLLCANACLFSPTCSNEKRKVE